MKLNRILGLPDRDLKAMTEIEKRDLAMTGIEQLIEFKKRQDKKEFDELFGDGIRLNLGCGNKKMKGFINIDSRKNVKPNIVHDLENGLPKGIEENSVTGVYASHIFEHIRNFIPLMENIWKVCKNGAKIQAIVPLYISGLAFVDPTHVRYFAEHTFEYFDKDFQKMNSNKFDYSFNCDFKTIEKRIDEKGIMYIILEVRKCQENLKKKKKLKK